MTEDDVSAANVAVAANEPVRPGEESQVATPGTQSPPHYWLRVHGYPGDLSSEAVYYNDFRDLVAGPLPGDPLKNLSVGDVIVYYADGPASLYGIATISAPIEGPAPDFRGGTRWTVPIKREAIIRVVNKAPHAAGLRPPIDMGGDPHQRSRRALPWPRRVPVLQRGEADQHRRRHERTGAHAGHEA